ncbi:hypothetical protein [Burkholderia sp. MBR-1]|uniref:hypothetical protein n=1 Tax=Burkholderia sp. MBR-1 TaxID=2732364 RepID=UPI0015EE8345|nr:hypothetical protein [Burkholderia sp. MBR-1]QMI49703.1 hypothetical protein MBR110_29920 [Burkholderia sp. MBR-1]
MDDRDEVKTRIAKAMNAPKELPERELALETEAIQWVGRKISAIEAIDHAIRMVNLQIHRAIPSRAGKISVRFNYVRKSKSRGQSAKRPVMVKWVTNRQDSTSGRQEGGYLPRELRDQRDLVKQIPRPTNTRDKRIVNHNSVERLLKLVESLMAQRRELVDGLVRTIRGDAREVKEVNALLTRVEKKLPSIAQSIEFDWTDPVGAMDKIGRLRARRAAQARYPGMRLDPSEDDQPTPR